MPSTSTIDEAARLSEIIAKARQDALVDPRPKLGLQILATHERKRSEALAMRAEQIPTSESVPVWQAHSRIARAAADQIQALCDEQVDPTGTQEGSEHPKHEWAEWNKIEAGVAEPNEYQAHVIEAMADAIAAGLSCNAETGPHVAALMAARWGYPDERENAPEGSDFRVVRNFGSHCYSARCVIRARERRVAMKKAAGELRIGAIPGRIITGSLENLTSAIIVSISHTSEKVEIQAKRGPKAVTWAPDAVEALNAIVRGEQWAKKHARKAVPA
jgi:hypothetical protein